MKPGFGNIQTTFSSSRFWAPRTTVTQITGGIRIAFTPKTGEETEIWCAVNGGTLYLITTCGIGVSSYDWTVDSGADFAFQLRSKNDQTVLTAPSIFATLISGGARVTITDTNAGICAYQVYVSTGGSYSLAGTTAIGGTTYDYMDVGVSVQFKVRGIEGTLPVYSDYSNITDSLVILIVDYDGNTYNPVTIGTQVWLDKNLMTTHYNDGSAIDYPADADWTNNVNGGYGWVNDDITNKAGYGAFYNKPAYTNAKGICPDGYHVPTPAEIVTLTAYLGGDTVSAGAMKEAGTTHWNTTNVGTFTSGLNLPGAGYKHETNGGTSLNKGYGMYAESNGDEYYMSNSSTTLSYVTPNVKRGLSVRCIKN